MLEIILSHPTTYVFLLYVAVVVVANVYADRNRKQSQKNRTGAQVISGSR